MSTKKEIMTVKGFDKNNQDINSPCDVKKHQPFSKVVNGKHFGMPISRRRFNGMLNRFLQYSLPGVDNPFADLQWVDFSKASLMRVMAQENVEYVRFYFAIPRTDMNYASLALEGIDANGNPVRKKQKMAAVRAFVESIGMDEDTTADASGDTYPSGDNEEMGNGGGDNGGGGKKVKVRNIASMNEFIAESVAANKITLSETLIPGNLHPFENFMQHFYDYAQKNFKGMK